MALIHTVTWRDDARQQTKFRSWIRSDNDEKSHWRRRGGVIRIALLCSSLYRFLVAKNFPKADTPLSTLALTSIIPGAQRRSISVRPDRSVDRLAAQIPGGGCCQ
jgi:hypothetical protein